MQHRAQVQEYIFASFVRAAAVLQLAVLLPSVAAGVVVAAAVVVAVATAAVAVAAGFGSNIPRAERCRRQEHRSETPPRLLVFAAAPEQVQLERHQTKQLRTVAVADTATLRRQRARHRPLPLSHSLNLQCVAEPDAVEQTAVVQTAMILLEVKSPHADFAVVSPADIRWRMEVSHDPFR